MNKTLTPDACKAIITNELTPKVTSKLTHDAVTLSFFSGNGCYMFEDALAKLTNDYITQNDSIRNLEVQYQFLEGNNVHYYVVCEDSDFYYGFRVFKVCDFSCFTYTRLAKDHERADILLHPCTLGEIFDAWY